MEITINTSGFGLQYNMNSSWSINPDSTVSVTLTEPETITPLEEIQEHLDAIKAVFFAEDYDDKTMGFLVEDHIIAIQEILDDNGL